MEWWCLDIRSHIASSFTILLLRFLLNFSFNWKRYQTLKTVFNHIFKHLEVPQKYSCARHIFTSLARHDLSFFIHYSCNSKLLPQVRKREIIVVCLDIWFFISKFYWSFFSLFSTSIRRYIKCSKQCFDHIPKHHEFRQKYSAACQVFTSFLWMEMSDTVFRIWDTGKRLLIFQLIPVTGQDYVSFGYLSPIDH